MTGKSHKGKPRRQQAQLSASKLLSVLKKHRSEGNYSSSIIVFMSGPSGCKAHADIMFSPCLYSWSPRAGEFIPTNPCAINPAPDACSPACLEQAPTKPAWPGAHCSPPEGRFLGTMYPRFHCTNRMETPEDPGLVLPSVPTQRV